VNVYQFMSESPFLTFFMSYMVLETLFRMWKVVGRHLNIRKAGWPPPHLDADGDFKPEPEKEEKEAQS